MKEILGASATILAIIGYIPYFKDMFQGRTKPHAFSWLIWGILTAIRFVGQVVDNGGPGAWVTGLTAIVCFFIFGYSLIKGERSITRLDWLCLIASGIALILWFVTKGPLFSVILITLIDGLGFIPTFRKSFFKPNEETLSTYLLGGVKFLISLFALNNFSIITALYPASLVFMNWVFIGMLIVRRKQLTKTTIVVK